MAGNIDKFLKFLRLTDEDDYEDDYDYDYDDGLDDEKELRKEEKRLQRQQRREEKKASGISPERSESFEDYRASDTVRRSTARTSSPSMSGSKVVPINRNASSGFEVCITKPMNFGDSQRACEILLGGQPVVVNFEGMDTDEAQRIMDFISGCIFAISGNMRPISRYIFIFSPKNIDISGDYIKNIAEGKEGINFPTLDNEF